MEVEPPSGKAGKGEGENPQGMVKVHKLPVLTEKGGGGGGGGDDLAFSLSRRRFMFRKFSLPPVEGDQEAQRGRGRWILSFRAEDGCTAGRALNCCLIQPSLLMQENCFVDIFISCLKSQLR